jgi:hypothetical protein
MNKKYIDFYNKFILQTKTLNDGGIEVKVTVSFQLLLHSLHSL